MTTSNAATIVTPISSAKARSNSRAVSERRKAVCRLFDIGHHPPLPAVGPRCALRLYDAAAIRPIFPLRGCVRNPLSAHRLDLDQEQLRLARSFGECHGQFSHIRKVTTGYTAMQRIYPESFVTSSLSGGQQEGISTARTPETPEKLDND